MAQITLTTTSKYCNISEMSTESFSKHVVPPLSDKNKGDAGRICVIGGSTEYTGAPYFAAISALKAGADLVYVITTESAAPIIKTYSPDLIVYPFLHQQYLQQISSLMLKMDVIIIGPGLGRENATISLIYNILSTCKNLMKPLVIDADGLYAISKNLSVIEQYPSPGVILTPNHLEADRLEKSMQMQSKASNLSNYLGDFVSVLVKGKVDKFYSKILSFEWQIKDGGSGRRAGGQGDILAGFLGTFLNWALKSNLCANYHPTQLAQSLATIAAANLTRMCNYKAFNKMGRSMTATDMLTEIHEALDIVIKEN